MRLVKSVELFISDKTLTIADTPELKDTCCSGISTVHICEKNMQFIYKDCILSLGCFLLKRTLAL